ncbi:SseB family protein [Lutimaribacter sp. EGI FJ00015]|uniref:SseB family protein n=1 Tax=Lutimaribacter degradans TaxID=2945989 RepID=A0ACC5ZZR0_9RHOB|nr:SseB family protein [Lutimaribacter sp. EGI FJ00013]MCM2563532.1 SseB family protein [Lutimaribacter sp. EGI FJ00013]MCO0614712.1 SseB family protein [Lutimaribacter sp. EGI FJ00015]MCO0637382.1 SseB family protein [Lutimaribacter sp. EGI FJ00014]
METDPQTPLDRAFHAMEAAPDDALARARYYEVLADTELFLVLREEPRGDQIAPDLFELGEQTFVVAFDAEDRMGHFTGGPAPYAAISGRVLAGMLAPQGIGLGVNLEAGPTSFLVPAEALDWLVETLGTAPQETQARVVAIHAPGRLPEAVLDALASRLTRAAGLARAAFLVEAEYDSGARAHMLAILGAQERTQAPLAKTVSEALTFSGIEAGALDVVFIAPDDPRLPTIEAYGMRLDIPAAPEPPRVEHVAPGSDPDKPPKLR